MPVSVNALYQFFRNPSRHLLNERLGLYLDDNTAVTADREPFDVTGLERYDLDQRILEQRLSGKSRESFFPVMRAAGTLPPGTVGACLFDKISREVDRFAAAVVAATRSAVPESIDVDQPVGSFRLCGTIDGVFPHGMVAYRCAEITPKDSLRVWINHLVLAMTGSRVGSCASRYLGLENRKPAIFEYIPVSPAESEKLLTCLLEHYRFGLAKPLHFFPVSSWEYAEAVIIRKRSGEVGLISAKKKWEGDDFHRGEGDDSYYRQCFGNENPLDDSFREIAVTVLGPLFEYRKKIDL